MKYRIKEYLLISLLKKFSKFAIKLYFLSINNIN